VSNQPGDIDEIIQRQAFTNVKDMTQHLLELDEVATRVYKHVMAGMTLLNKATGIKGISSGVESLVKETSRITSIQQKIETTNRKIIEAESLHAQMLAESEMQLRNTKKANDDYIKSKNAAAGSIDAYKLRLQQLEKQINAVADSQGKGAVQVQKLVKEYNTLHAVIIKHNQSMGNFRDGVGNYEKGFKGMNMAVMQLTREMPAFANSMQTGFMAISNNLPALFDSVKQIREENKLAMAEAKAKAIADGALAKQQAILAGATQAAALQMEKQAVATSMAMNSAIAGKGVFATMAASLFSVQTALSLGVLALTMYGPKLFAMVQGTDEAAEKAKLLKEEQDKLNESIGKQTGKIEAHIRILNDKNASHQVQLSIAKDLKEAYPTMLNNYSLEEIAAGKAAKAINQIRDALIEVAMARAAQETMDKLAAKKWAIIEKTAETKAKLGIAQQRLDGAGAAPSEIQLNPTTGVVTDASSDKLQRAKENVVGLKLELAALAAEASAVEKQMTETSNRIETSTLKALKSGMNVDGSDITKGDKKDNKAKNRIEVLKQQYDTEVALLSIKHDSGEMETNEYYHNLMLLDRQYFAWRAGLNADEKQAEVQFNQELAAAAKDHHDKQATLTLMAAHKDIETDQERNEALLKSATELNNEIQRIHEKGEKARNEEVKNRVKKEDELNKEILDGRKRLMNGLATLEQEIFNIAEQRVKQRAAEEIKAIDEREARELKALEHLTLTDKQREEAKAKIELEAEVRREQTHRDEVKRLRRLAIFQKTLAAGEIVTNTALAISKHSKLLPPANYIQMAADAVIGAAQLTRVLGQQIPQYAKGREGGPAEFAEVNEQGPEVVRTKEGKYYVPNKGKRGITFLPAGADVIPANRVKGAALREMSKGSTLNPTSNNGDLANAFLIGSGSVVDQLKKTPPPIINIYSDGLYQIRYKSRVR